MNYEEQPRNAPGNGQDQSAALPPRSNDAAFKDIFDDYLDYLDRFRDAADDFLDRIELPNLNNPIWDDYIDFWRHLIPSDEEPLTAEDGWELPPPPPPGDMICLSPSCTLSHIDFVVVQAHRIPVRFFFPASTRTEAVNFRGYPINYTMDRITPGEGIVLDCSAGCGTGVCAQWISSTDFRGTFYYLWVRMGSQYWIASEAPSYSPVPIRPFYNFPCDPVPPPGQPRPPTPPEDEEDEMACCSCASINAIVMTRLEPVMEKLLEAVDELEKAKIAALQARNILGGGAWFDGETDVSPSLEINPEKRIESVRSGLYPDPLGGSQDLTTFSLLDWMTALQTPAYHRAGFHRLPATVLTDITGDDSTEEIPDALGFQEWIVLQIDALIGQFPLNLEVKDADGELKRIQFGNISEAMSEIIGSIIASSQDSDLILEILLKNLTETIKAGNSANVASQYAKANSEFLGYQIKQQGQEVPYSVTPGGQSLKEILTPSKKRQVVPVFDDKTDLMSAIGRLAIDVGIVKAAFTRQAADLDSLPLPGEGISQQRANRNSQEDTEWAQFISEVEVPPAQYQVDPATPKPDIKDLSI